VNTPAAPSTYLSTSAPPRVLRAFGDEVTIHLSGAETGGRYTMFTVVTPPGGGPPPHRHMNEDEWFLVQEGAAEFWSNGAWAPAPVGTVVYTTRGVVHTFRNAGSGPLKMLVHAAPSGFERFFARCAEEFARPGEPDMPRLVSIAGEHGIQFAAS
jgi:quercetin dioxygenase-like cupin family protein